MNVGSDTQISEEFNVLEAVLEQSTFNLVGI